ncbi:MAG: hypothetical protein IT384_09890 [Deltaproteobacteria bacterium]|nr:hypothetical protein [Deltaproteobacteria bacterium]
MLAWAAGLVVLAASDVLPEQLLNRARVCATDLDFECAERALSELTGEIQALPAELAREALVLRAEVALSTERWREAEERLLAVLLYDPRFAPEEGAWPPRWKEALTAARARVPDQEGPEIRVGRSEGRAGVELVVRATIVDPSGVERASLLLAGTREALVMTSTGGRSFLAVIPAERVRPPVVAFWIEAFDRYGNGPSRAGAPDRPLEVAVREPANPLPSPAAVATAAPLTSAWWFWASVGAVAIGAGAAIAWAAGSKDEPGSVRARLQWPPR